MDFLNFFDEDDDLDALDLILYGIPRRINIRADHFYNMTDLDFFSKI